MQELEIDAVRVALGQAVVAALDARAVPRAVQRELLALSADEWARVQKGAPLPLQFEVLERAGYLQLLAARHDDHWWTALVQGLLDGGLAALAAAAQDETNEA